MGATEATKNSAFLTGIIASPYYLAYTTQDGTCYKVFVSVRRLSGVEDVIRVIVPESCLADTVDATGHHVTVKGTYQSRSRYGREEKKRHLDLFVYADVFTFTDFGSGAADTADGSTEGDGKSSNTGTDINHLVLEGFITKDTMFRTTPKGKKITDFMMAVNSPDPKHPNYIPCIAWGKNAYLADTMTKEYHIRIEGRIQSREYDKILRGDNGETVAQKRVAYEVSCSSLEILETAEEARGRRQREREEKKNGNAA